MPKRGNQERTIELPTRLLNELEPLLKDKNLTLDETVRLYLRSLVTRSKKNAAMAPGDDFTFGKYKDEELTVVIRAEPDYVVWCQNNLENFHLTPEAQALLDEMLGTEDDDNA